MVMYGNVIRMMGIRRDGWEWGFGGVYMSFSPLFFCLRAFVTLRLSLFFFSFLFSWYLVLPPGCDDVRWTGRLS
jgi:hypothetical protein